MTYAYEGKPGEGMQLRNRAQWLAIGDFLARQNLRLVLQERARSEAAQALACGSGAQGAQLSTLPVGNHGEIVAKGVGA